MNCNFSGEMGNKNRNKSRTKKKGRAAMAQKMRRMREKERAQAARQAQLALELANNPNVPSSSNNRLPFSVEDPVDSTVQIKCEIEETDESILQSLPNLGIVKREPLDSDDFSEAEGESSKTSIPGPSTSSYSTPSLQSHEFPTLQRPPDATPFILPDAPSPSTSTQSPALPAAVGNSTEPEKKPTVVSPIQEHRKSRDSNQPNTSSNGRSGIHDKFSIFGSFVVRKLLSLKSEQYQTLAQERIKQLLIDIEMEEFEVYSGVSDQPKKSHNDDSGISTLQQISAVKGKSSNISISRPSTSLCPALSTQSHEVPSIQTDSEVAPSILPVAPSSQTHMQTHGRPANDENSPETEKEISAATPSQKRGKSEDSDHQPKKICNGCRGNRNEFSIFGEFVACRLHSLKNRQYQTLAQERIKQLLINFEMKEFEDESEVASDQSKSPRGDSGSCSVVKGKSSNIPIPRPSTSFCSAFSTQSRELPSLRTIPQKDCQVTPSGLPDAP